MTAILTSGGRRMAAVGGSAAMVGLLIIAWSCGSFGATSPGVEPGTIGASAPWYRQTHMLALAEPDLGMRDPAWHEIETPSPDGRDNIFAVRPQPAGDKAARASKPLPASAKQAAAPTTKLTKVASAAQVAPAAQADVSTESFMAPDISRMVVPAAALSVMTLSVAELSRGRSSTPTWSGPAAANTSAKPSPIDDSAKMPGPFHVFFTTGPADGMAAMDTSSSGTSSGSGGVIGALVGNGGVVSSVGGTVGSTVGAVGNTVGAVGGTVGGVVGTVGGTVGGLLKH